MEVHRTPAAMRAALEPLHRRGVHVGLVPTMGALHEGHLSLLEMAKALTAARSEGSFVALSIFVNPTQFAPGEDLARYPRDLNGDLAKCEAAGADAVFVPQVEDMYPPRDQTRVRVGPLAEPLCGAFRAGHFEGVATVVAKLFALFGPCTAVFGQKDYQQLRVIQQMAEDLLFPVRVVSHPTLRESDGLAQSSRNAYLSPEERAQAAAIPRSLSIARELFRGGASAELLVDRVTAELRPACTSMDYVAVVDPVSLQARTGTVFSPVLLAIAVRIGRTRLIDNIVLGVDADPVASGEHRTRAQL